MGQLKEKKKQLCKEQQRGFQETDFVFAWDDGRPYNPDYISKLFKKAVRRCPFTDDRLLFFYFR